MKQLQLIKFINANKILDDLKLDGLSGNDKYKIIKAIRKVKAIVKEFEEFKQDIINKYVSDEKFGENLKIKDENEEANNYINKINEEVNELLLIEATSTKTIDGDLLDEELFIKLIEINDLSIKNSLLLEEVLLNNDK